MTVLLTRPEAESRAVAEELAAHGIATLVWPLTRIEMADGPVALPDGTDGLLFTSANGVRAFAASNPERDLPALCVGDRTADIARELGFARAESADGDAGALARLAARSGLGRLFHPRGRDSAADMAALLAPHGIDVSDAVSYVARPTGPPPPRIAAALATGEIGVLTLWSARNARIFSALWGTTPVVDLGSVTAVAISDRAAAVLEGVGFRAILTADRPDRAAMIGRIRQADAALRR